MGICFRGETGDGDTHVVGMYVAPEARGSGCAHQLLDAIAELTVRRQGKRLVLEVAESNIRATRSYRSYGFVATGRRRSLERDPSITEIEFAYPLSRGRDIPDAYGDSIRPPDGSFPRTSVTTAAEVALEGSFRAQASRRRADSDEGGRSLRNKSLSAR